VNSKVKERQDSSYSPPGRAEILVAVAVILYIFAKIFARTKYATRWLAHKGLLISFLIMLFVVGVSLAIFVLARVLSRRSKIDRQPLRDLEANLAGPFCLFLRTFYFDQNARFPNPYLRLGLYSVEPFTIGPEEFVARVLEPSLHVREVGGTNAIATSRIRLDDRQWHEVVRDACARASLIVILPLIHEDINHEIAGEAMLWEFMHLAENGDLNKTLALMPPNIPRHSKTNPNAWERTRLHSSEFCVDLPVYDKRGAVIMFERHQGRWKGTAMLDRKGMAHKQLARSLIEAANTVAARFDVELLQW
jgi:hypothetical protein